MDLIQRLNTEADLCKNEGADDIASLLWEAAEALAAYRAQSAVQEAHPVACLSERGFAEWLNMKRDADVSQVFHDIVAHYAAAIATPSHPVAAAVQEAPPAQGQGVTITDALLSDLDALCDHKRLKFSERETIEGAANVLRKARAFFNRSSK